MWEKCPQPLLQGIMKLKQIPQFTGEGNYRINQPWSDLESWIERETKELGLDLDPDFQRAHVWDEKKQIAFVEFCLKGGKHSNIIRFNCVGWMGDFRGPFVLVDGKQRLEAIRKFLQNELYVFKNLDNQGNGFRLCDFEGNLKLSHDVIIVVNNLATRREVLQWYLDINSGGVVHTNEELNKVKQLLEKES
jgi:hypothetical protein